MSSAYAIAAVSSVLKALLDHSTASLTATLGTAVTVSALAPENVPQNKDDGPCLNLFLFQVSPSAAYRNNGLPTVDARGQRAANPPLALELRYLLTAYGSGDLQAEILLGHALQCLHQSPVLTRDMIRAALPAPADPKRERLTQALHVSGLAEQVEMIKLTPAAAPLDELSKLWTALQANYRPSAIYECSLVLIESSLPGRAALPVLSRGPVLTRTELDPVTLLPVQRRYEAGVVVQGDADSPFPELQSLAPASQQGVAIAGDTLILGGRNLAAQPGSGLLLLENARLGLQRPFGPPSSANASEVRIALGGPPSELPAGVYAARLRLMPVGDTQARETNALALQIAPQFAANPLPAQIAPDAQRHFTLQPACITTLRPGQRVSLLLGAHEAPAAVFDTPTTTPSFTFSDVPAGLYRVRLRVDGVDSLHVDRTQSPPVYLGPQIEVLA